MQEVMRSRRNVTAMLLFILFLTRGGYGQPGWSDVQPAIQQISYWGPDLSIEHVKLHYLEPEFRFAVVELKRCLESNGIVVDTVYGHHDNSIVGNFYDPNWGEEDHIIRLGSWSIMSDIFISTGKMEFQTEPIGEEYYIHAFDDGIVDVVAVTPRAMNYAVTSLCNAVYEDQGLRLCATRIVDYPRFEKRLIAFHQPFGAGSRDWAVNGGDWG